MMRKLINRSILLLCVLGTLISMWWSFDVPSNTQLSFTRNEVPFSQEGEPSRKNDGRAKKIILFTYMRGGSTFLGSLFSAHPDSFYWYESLGYFYYQYLLEYPATISVQFYGNNTIRTIPTEEIDAQVQFLDNLFKCDTQDMYPDALSSALMMASPSTKNLSECFYNSRSDKTRKCVLKNTPVICKGPRLDRRLAAGCHVKAEAARVAFQQGQIIGEDAEEQLLLERLKCHVRPDVNGDTCVQRMEDKCHGSRLRVTKVHRLSMQAVEAIIRKIPDVQIVYYVRDPRGIWTSRNGKVPIKTQCKLMEKDYKYYLKISEKFPENIYFLRYEDLAGDTLNVAERLYNYLGEPLLPAVREHIRKITHSNSTQANRNQQGYIRRDSTLTSNAWRKKIRGGTNNEAKKYCANVFKLMGYEV